MIPQKIKRSLIAVLVSTLMILMPVASSFARNQGRGHGDKGRGANRMSVRQYNKRHYTRPPGHRPPAHRPPGHRPPGHRPPAYRPHRYKYRPARYKGRYYHDYRAWRLAAGVTAGILIGTMLASPPPLSQTVVIKERTYYVYDNVYYEPVLDGGRVVYQVVPSPY